MQVQAEEILSQLSVTQDRRIAGLTPISNFCKTVTYSDWLWNYGASRLHLALGRLATNKRRGLQTGREKNPYGVPRFLNRYLPSTQIIKRFGSHYIRFRPTIDRHYPPLPR